MEWKSLINKLDGNGPPLKKQRLTNPNMSKKLVPYQNFESNMNNNKGMFDVILPYFDIQHHGYFMNKGELFYKQPDGKRLKATGVDSFPDIFPDPPKHYTSMWGASNHNSSLHPHRPNQGFRK